MRKTMTKSLLAYPGAKNILARKYEPYYPPHRLFVSPFGGSGAEIMRKRPSPIEVWSDTDDRLYDMFSLLQDDCEYAQLVDLVKRTRNSREQYLECRRILDESRTKHTRVRGVWAFLVCATIGYRGPHPMRVRSWSSHATSRRRLRDLPETLKAWRRRFRTVQAGTRRLVRVVRTVRLSQHVLVFRSAVSSWIATRRRTVLASLNDSRPRTIATGTAHCEGVCPPLRL